MDCNSTVEFAYYAQNNTVPVDKTICCYCTAPQVQKDKELLKKYRVVLPICMPCKANGKDVLKRNPIKWCQQYVFVLLSKYLAFSDIGFNTLLY